MDHIIRFHDKSKRTISQRQAEQLIEASVSGVNGITVGGGYIAFNSIAKILPENEYYDQYPQERPLQLPQFENKALGMGGVIRETNSVKALDHMIRGIKKHMRSVLFRGTDRPQNLVDQMETKIKLIQQNNEATIS